MPASVLSPLNTTGTDRWALAGGLAVAGTGLVAAAGWVWQLHWLAAPWRGHGAPNLVAALGLTLVGTALGLYAWRPSRRVPLPGAGTAMALASAALVLLADGLGHSVLGLSDAGPNGPQRASLVLILIAAVPLAMRPWAGRKLTHAAMRAGSLLIAGYVIIAALVDGFGVGYLYSAALLSPPEPHLYAALPVLAWALWRLSAAESGRAARPIAPDNHIVRAAGIALGGTVVLGALLGFVSVMKAIEAGKGDWLTTSAYGHAQRLEGELDAARRAAAIVGGRPALSELLTALQSAASPAAVTAARTALARYANGFLDGWFSGLAMLDAEGRPILQMGRFLRDPQVQFELPDRARHLLWDGQLWLRSRIPVRGKDGPVGYVELEQAMPETTASLAGVAGLGATGEVSLCARQGAEKLCLPSRFNPQPVRAPIPANPIQASDRGLSGQSGLFRTVDYRRQMTLSAVSPLPADGLAMIAKMDVAELFGPLRRQIEWGLPLVALVAFGGFLALRARVRPLAGALVEAKEKAEASSLRWAALNESAIDGFLLLRAERGDTGELLDLRAVEMNPAARRMTGTQAAEPLLSEAFDMPPSAELAARCAEALDSGVATACEVEVSSERLKAAGLCWLHLNIVPFGDGIALTARDITARKQGELELARAQQRMQLVTDNVPILLGYIDAEQRFGFINRTCTGLLGDTAAAVGRSVREALGEKNYAAIEPFIAAALRGEKVRFGRWQPWGDGERYLDATYVPDLDADGRVRGYFAAVADQTALRRAEEEARALAERLQTITDTLPVLIAFIDTECVFRFNNKAYVDWFGRPLAEITGRPVADLLKPEVLALTQATMERSAQSRQPVTIEREEHRDGKVMYLEVLYAPQFAEDGRLLGFCLVTKDITQSKRYELQLLNEARRDALTDLPNRLTFEDRLTAALDRLRRPGSFAVAYVDVDHFKQVNDEYGHAAGDVLLKVLAQRCVAALRRSDTPARLGGDEFALILEELSQPEDIDTIARKLFSAWAPPVVYEGRAIAMSCSVGIAVYVAGDTAKSILQRADEALYEAKRSGRNTFVIAR